MGPTDPSAGPRDASRPTMLGRLGAAGDRMTSEPEHPAARRALRIALGIVVAGSLAAAVATQWSRLPEIDWHLRPGWLLLALLALALFQVVHIEIWRLILAELGSPIPRRPGWTIWSVTLLARFVPTNALMALGRIALSEKEGIPKRVTLASLVYEVALGTVGALVVGALVVVELPGLQDTPARWAVFAVPLVTLLAMHPRIFRRWSDAVLRRLGRATLPLAMPIREVLVTTALMAVSFVVAGVAVWAFAHGLHEVQAGDTPVAIASYAVGWLAALVGFLLPGGLGAREAGTAAALALVLPTAVAIAVVIGIRLMQVGVELGFAALTSAASRRSAREAAKDRPREVAQHGHQPPDR